MLEGLEIRLAHQIPLAVRPSIYEPRVGGLLLAPVVSLSQGAPSRQSIRAGACRQLGDLRGGLVVTLGGRIASSPTPSALEP